MTEVLAKSYFIFQCVKYKTVLYQMVQIYRPSCD